MKTISLNGPRSISVIDQAIDDSFVKMATLKVISSGICAADSYLWSGNHPWNISYPIVPGHEIFGEVIAIHSENDQNLQMGSKVSVQVNVPCYRCEMCQKSRFNMCVTRRHFGSTFKGSFAEQIAIPIGSRVHSYTKPIDDLIGGLTETMANAIYCSRKIPLQSEASVLILGMGSIGACLVHYLQTTFPNINITVLTSSETKRNILEEFGIKHISLSDATKVSESFDVIFETSGFEDNFKVGLNSLKPNGAAIIYGVFQEKMLIDFNQISEFKELTLIGGHLADDESFRLSVAFLSEHQTELGYLISNVVGFDDFALAFTDSKFLLFKTLFQPTFGKGA